MTKKQKKMLARILLSATMLLGLHFLPVEGLGRFLLYLIPYLTIGYDILRKAWKGIRNKQVFDENFLMAIATIGAMLQGILQGGDYVEAIAVMLFYQIGELFQSYAVGKSRKNISALMDIRPDYANLETDGALERVDPDAVPVGSIIVVQPGEKVPIDGVVTEGSSSLNTSALTGESLPRDVTAGDEIISGCINLTGVLRIQTTREFGESTVSKVLDLVENASSRKSRSEDFISKFARIYTPAVCVGALFLAVVPPVFGLLFGSGSNWGQWLYRALTFLVASCPCALVISIPLSFFAGIGGASTQGILVKGSNYLEALSKTGWVVFDKTGTLTYGRLEVSDVISFDKNIDEDALLSLVASAEAKSEHPLGKAIVACAKTRNVPILASDIFKMTAGKGIYAEIENRKLFCGNEAYLNENSVVLSEEIKQTIEALRTQGKASILAAEGTKCIGVLAMSDVLRPEAKGMVDRLHSMNTDIVLLTGDNQKTANYFARQVGIKQVRAQLLPEEKVSNITAIQNEGKDVCMIGDGVNDAPALKTANVGVAMGGLGSDIAVEAADIVLMSDDISKLPYLKRLSNATVKTIKFSIGLSMCINFIAVALSVVGALNPTTGALVHNAGSCFVVLIAALLYDRKFE